MPRLPTPDGDADQWGALLNEYLRVAHREDGALRGTIEVVNVKDFGAQEDGMADDAFAAAQAAVNPGGIIFVPYGTYLLSSWRWDKPCTIMGAGWTHGSATFGHPYWTTNPPTGSILKFTHTSGWGLTIGNGSPSGQFNLVDIAIIGTGARGTTGIAFGSRVDGIGGISSHWRNVLVGNFDTGVNLDGPEQCGFYDLRIRGCNSGMILTGGQTAANWFVGLDVQGIGSQIENGSYTGVGVDFVEDVGFGRPAGNTILGGIFQANWHHSLRIAGTGNRVLFCWFENNDSDGADLILNSAVETLVAWCMDFKRSIEVIGGADTQRNYFYEVQGNPEAVNNSSPPPFIIGPSVKSTRIDKCPNWAFTDNGDGTLVDGVSAITAAVLTGGQSAETDLQSRRIFKKEMNAYGSLQILAAGTVSGGGGEKSIKLYWHTTVIATLELAAGDTGAWSIEVELLNHANVAAQKIRVKGYFGNRLFLQDYLTAAVDTSATDVTIKTTGTTSSSSDGVISEMLLVRTGL